jgi:hypothetical protein
VIGRRGRCALESVLFHCLASSREAVSLRCLALRVNNAETLCSSKVGVRRGQCLPNNVRSSAAWRQWCRRECAYPSRYWRSKSLVALAWRCCTCVVSRAGMFGRGATTGTCAQPYQQDPSLSHSCKCQKKTKLAEKSPEYLLSRSSDTNVSSLRVYMYKVHLNLENKTEVGLHVNTGQLPSNTRHIYTGIKPGLSVTTVTWWLKLSSV